MSFTGVTSTVNAREFVLLRAIIINRILSLFLGFFICFLVYFVGVKCPDKIYIFHTLSPAFGRCKCTHSVWIGADTHILSYRMGYYGLS